ncbi:MAG: DUF3298 domain-containing protein [Xanthomonadaceae bacterium]|nr:DUF3298 domain-containing protein [Xanthomonadaceae bacterium]
MFSGLRWSGFPAAAAILCLACVGCSERDTGPSASATPVASAAAAESQPETDAGKGKGYAFEILYPLLEPEWQPLVAAVHRFAAIQKTDFLDASTAADRATGVDYSLDLTFAVTRRTADFVSVTASGSAFVGGAHGVPILASFNLDLANGKLTALPDLFTDAQSGLQALSDECRHQLEGRYAARLRDGDSAMAPAQKAAQIASMNRWIERGTQPTPENFRVFLVDGLDSPAIGLTVIFPPYQVAAYVDGVQQVEVPAKVFYDLLKPEYKDAFAIDTEARNASAGVR